MKYVDLIHLLHEGSVIDFCEYSLDRHERKHVSVSIKDGVVRDIFPPNKQLSRETLEQYYGEGLEDVDYLQLSQMNCLRVVTELGVNPRGEVDIKILTITQDFMDSGLQTIEVTNELTLADQEPNYMLAQRGW